MADQRAKLRLLDELAAPALWEEIEARHPRPDLPPHRVPQRRRLGTIALAVALAVAGTVFAVTALGPTGRPIASQDTKTWPTHRIDMMHLEFSYPSEWYLQPVDGPVGHAEMIGSVVSNIDHRFHHPDLGPNHFTSAWDLRGLPTDGVVVSIEHFTGGPLSPPQPDSHRPLNLGQARPSPGEYLDQGWVGLFLPFTHDGIEDAIFVWFGPEASDHDREVARRVVASIGPIPREVFGGWTADSEVVPAVAGPLAIEIGPVRPAPRNDAHPWIQHDVILRNLSSRPLTFGDTRVGKLLGKPGPELFAADDGCGYAKTGNSEVEWGFCLQYLDAFTIPPHGVERRTITLFKGLPGLAPLRPGQYDFSKVYRFRIGDEGERVVHVRFTYEIRPAGAST